MHKRCGGLRVPQAFDRWWWGRCRGSRSSSTASSFEFAGIPSFLLSPGSVGTEGTPPTTASSATTPRCAATRRSCWFGRRPEPTTIARQDLIGGHDKGRGRGGQGKARGGRGRGGMRHHGLIGIVHMIVMMIVRMVVSRIGPGIGTMLRGSIGNTTTGWRLLLELMDQMSQLGLFVTGFQLQLRQTMYQVSFVCIILRVMILGRLIEGKGERLFLLFLLGWFHQTRSGWYSSVAALLLDGRCRTVDPVGG